MLALLESNQFRDALMPDEKVKKRSPLRSPFCLFLEGFMP